MPERKSKEKYDIPLYRKPFLSIEEAVAYTGIGRDRRKNNGKDKKTR